MGQFDAQRAERAPERFAEADLGAGRQGRRDIDDQAGPAAAMVEDQDPVIVAERAGEADEAVGGGADRRSAPGREGRYRGTEPRCR